ncbi:MAG: septum formation initiator family protein [Actinobacteria bacterium]|nr:septum formation initiator family protein [Actinomycetota bacterium]
MTAVRPAAAPERAPAPLRPDLTIVRRRRARRSMFTKLGTVLLFALFLVVFGVVVFQTLRMQNQAKLDEIDKRIAAEEDYAKSLRLKLADAESPDKIAEAARTRLGMIQPNDIAYLQPKPDDEAKAAWDPNTDPLPSPSTTAPPPPPATLPAPPASVVPKTSAAAAPTTVARAPVPTTAPAKTTPTTRPTTPTTKPATTPTTAAHPATGAKR